MGKPCLEENNNMKKELNASKHYLEGSAKNLLLSCQEAPGKM